MKYALIAIVAVIALGAYLALTQKPASEESVLDVSLGTIEISDTPEERMQGLSGRESLPDDYGMLFVFPEKGSYGFWMKDMVISIDIIWLDDSGMIVGIDASVAPETYPEPFYPPHPVRYILETRAGLAAERGWSIGTVLELPLP